MIAATGRVGAAAVAVMAMDMPATPHAAGLAGRQAENTAEAVWLMSVVFVIHTASVLAVNQEHAASALTSVIVVAQSAVSPA